MTEWRGGYRKRGMTNAMDRAAGTKGSYQKLADAMGLSRQAVYRWRATGVPADRLIELEALTGVPRTELRPDLYAAPAPSNAATP